ncbi:MAG: ABC transporter permease [Planctomycetes bacterium]|nr:ABC transporter permease [Planctomycetota bacterium]
MQLSTKIEPPSGFNLLSLRELWRYKELLYFLVWRDIKVRYKQTVIGASWAIFQPLLAMIVFTLFFGKLAKIPSDGIPYPIFYYAALVPWLYFANAIANATNVMIENQRVITKIYFPRLLLPLSSVLSGVIDFLIAFAVLILMMLAYGIVPTIYIAMIPVFLLFAIASAFAVGVWVSALNAMYRDVRYIVPFFIQFWMFASPVVYPASLVPEKWRLIYGLNPMAGVIEGFRWALLGSGEPPQLIWASALTVVVALILGLFYFNKIESTVADVV